MATTFRRKNLRLPLDLFRGVRAYSVTARAIGRPFTNAALVFFSIDALRNAARRNGFTVFAYCFMPDHVHLLVAGTRRDSYLPDFMKDFKGTSGHERWVHEADGLWQKTYYDHVLRRDEDMITVARYIAANPVRAGLVANVADYPYTGSFVLNREALLSS
jgi:putative transposase